MSLHMLYSLSSSCPGGLFFFFFNVWPFFPLFFVDILLHSGSLSFQFLSLCVPSSNNHISFQMPFFFFNSQMNSVLPGWYSRLQQSSERSSLFFFLCFFFTRARQCCYQILSLSTLFSQLNFVLAREATASPALMLLLLFNFRCIAFHPVAASCASFIHNVL